MPLVNGKQIERPAKSWNSCERKLEIDEEAHMANTVINDIIKHDETNWFTCDRCGYEDDTDKRFTYPSADTIVCIFCKPERGE